jgi:AcrR family transcriptional regulator
MTTDGSGDGEEPDTRERIMEATYCALCEQGYADLTTSAIAERSELSTAALHYHYESKAALLESFLEFLLESFRGRVAEIEAETPGERLDALVETVFSSPADGATEFRTALLEIQAQSPYEEAFREQLVEFDAFLHGRVRETLADGIEDGVFRATVDPDAVASFVVTVLSGAHTRQVAVGADPDAAEDTLRQYLDSLHTDTEVDTGADTEADADGIGDPGGRR